VPDDKPLRFSYKDDFYKCSHESSDDFSSAYQSIKNIKNSFFASDINNEPLNNNNIKILILDDESLIRSSIKRHIFKINKEENLSKKISTFEAENCFEALQLIYSNFQNKIFFNIVLIDEYMPFMKGSTMIKLMKSLSQEGNFYNILFVSYTAFNTLEKKKYILDQGADHILNKPISYEDFKLFLLTLLRNNTDW
jgi:CheY-like chemotaxis protein